MQRFLLPQQNFLLPFCSMVYSVSSLSFLPSFQEIQVKVTNMASVSPILLLCYFNILPWSSIIASFHLTKSRAVESNRSRFGLAVRLWASYFISLNLSVIICTLAYEHLDHRLARHIQMIYIILLESFLHIHIIQRSGSINSFTVRECYTDSSMELTSSGKKQTQQALTAQYDIALNGEDPGTIVKHRCQRKY